MKKSIVGAALLGLMCGAVLTLFGANWIAPNGTEEREPAKQPGTLSTQQPSGGLICYGSVDVEGGVLSLYPTVPGKVVEVVASEGTAVTLGTPLLRLDDELAKYQITEAEAALAAAQVQLRQAANGLTQHKLLVVQQKASLVALEHDLKSAHLLATSKDKLVSSKFLAPEEAAASWELYKKVQAAIDAEKAKLAALQATEPGLLIESAKADVAAKTAQLDKARYGLEQCTVKAPVDGTVSRVLVGKGEVLGPTPKQPAILFCPAAPRIVRAEVEQEFAGVVKAGQQALVFDDTRNDPSPRKGKVVRLADMFTPRRTHLPTVLPVLELRVLEFIVELEPGPSGLRIGERVRVKLVKE